MSEAAILNHLWQSSAFALVAAVVAWALRRHGARVRFGVWLAASVKFLLPFGALAGMGAAIAPSLPRVPIPGGAGVAAQMEVVAVPITVGALPSAGGIPWLWVLGGVWLLGSMVLAGRWAGQWWRTARLAREAQPQHWGGLQLRVTRAAIEPGVFGVFRPVLLVPEGLEGRLTPAQWETVIAHERCHIARRDNLWAALHRAVETAFWFHPFVWWIGARMLAERERACDEAVLRAGGDAIAYAAGIVRVCRHSMAVPVVCAAGVSGGPLQQRVRAILDRDWGRKLGLKGRCALTGLGVLALLGPLALGAMHAQTKPGHFAAASIRPGEPISAAHPIQVGFHTDPTRLTAENVSLKDLIQYAYRLRPYQVVAPDWMTAERFSVSGTTEVPLSADDMQELLQPFLTRQFAIKSHRETKVMPVYALEVAPAGLTMPLSPDSLPANANLGRFMMRVAPEGLHLSGEAGMEQLAAVLSRSLDLPVVNKTGVSGVYKVDLTFSTPDGRVTMGGLPHPPQVDGKPIQMTAPTIFAALPQQLGLKLEKTKAPIELLVIDSAMKAPLGN